MGDYYATLEEAKRKCIDDDTCVKVLDFGCDSSSLFYLCSDESEDVIDDDGFDDGKPDCMYTKPGNKITFYITV